MPSLWCSPLSSADTAAKQNVEMSAVIQRRCAPRLEASPGADTVRRSQWSAWLNGKRLLYSASLSIVYLNTNWLVTTQLVLVYRKSSNALKLTSLPCTEGRTHRPLSTANPPEPYKTLMCLINFKKMRANGIWMQVMTHCKAALLNCARSLLNIYIYIFFYKPLMQHDVMTVLL